MSYIEVVCIGGENDGKRLDIPLDHIHFVLPVDNQEGMEFKTEHYFIERLSAGTEIQWFVARHESLTLEQTMEMLVKKYPQHGTT